MKQSLVLIGGGGHCKSCIDVIEQEGRFKIVGIVDIQEKVGQNVLGYDIIGTEKDLPQLITAHGNFLITVGQIQSPETRERLYTQAKNLGGHFPTIISPQAYVSDHARVAEATIVMHQALVNAGASVGKNCIINTRALVEHDAGIGDHCHIATGAIVNGGVTVGDRTFFGSGAVTKQYIRISSGSFIKANSLVKGTT